MQALRRYYYIYLFLVITWSPLQYFVLHFDNLGRTIAILNVFTILTLFFSNETRACITSKYTVPWLLWLITGLYVLFVIKGYHYHFYQKPILYVFKDLLTPLTAMYVVIFLARSNWITTCKLLIFAFVSYVVFVSFGGLSFSLAERELTVMGNSLPAAMVSLVFLTSFFLVNKVGKRGVLFFILFLALFLIFLSGARKSLFAAVIILFFAYLANLKTFNIKSIIRIVIVAAVSLYALDYLIDNSFYATRFDDSMDVGESTNTTNIKWLSFLGDRTIMYIEGFDFFLDNPITGIGLTNYYYYSSVHQMMHSEYMVQMAECGLIGMILFVLFYSRIITGILSRNNKNTINNRLMMIGYMLACLFVAFTAWIYSSAAIYLIYGLIISIISPLKNNTLSNGSINR